VFSGPIRCRRRVKLEHPSSDLASRGHRPGRVTGLARPSGPARGEGKTSAGASAFDPHLLEMLLQRLVLLAPFHALAIGPVHRPPVGLDDDA